MVHQIIHLAAWLMPAPTTDGAKASILLSVLLVYGAVPAFVAAVFYREPSAIQTYDRTSRARLKLGLVIMPLPALVFMVSVFGVWAAATIISLLSA